MENEILFDEAYLQAIEGYGDNSYEVSESQEENSFLNSDVDSSNSVVVVADTTTLNDLTATTNDYLLILCALLLSTLLFLFFHFAFVSNSDLK